MRVKQVLLSPSDIKAGPADDLEEGEFIVYPSTFTRTPDSYGDVVAKGAFLESIQRRKEAGAVLSGLYGHNMHDPHMNVAYATEEAEDDHGWRVRGKFDLDDPTALKVYKLVKGRRLRELSFAYDTLDEGRVELEQVLGFPEKTVTANELRKLDVHEFSFVPIGANRDTSIVAVKSGARTVIDLASAGQFFSTKNQGALRAAYESLGAVLEALKPDDAKARSSEPVKTDEEPEGAKSIEEPTRTTSAANRLQLELATVEFDSI